MRRKLACTLVSAMVLAGCGSSGGADEETQALEQRIAELEAEVASSTTAEPPATTEATTAQPPTSAAPTTVPPTTAPPTTAPPSLMPDVVCMNLQDAQDYIQATTDVFFSDSVDATGQGRMQLIDSNWIVVAQTPPPGTPIGEGDALLSVVKLEEPHDC